ncbi:MAG: cell division protein FtsA [Candidatus Latescibacteria bacterium]|nr:cell division protein FtsA [Candidatus Latescibacterota bacterium]MCK5527440.1 cell division protein FtsA [Candidatus Latescibacterota bacterium]
MDREEIVAGLDIGTTKISAIIALVGAGEEPKIIGAGTSPSVGLRRGVVINIEKTVRSIEKAVSEAELMAGVKIGSVYAGIAGDHIRSINSRGVIAVSRGDGDGNEITRDDVDRVIEAAKAVAIPMDREILHVLPQEYIVDNQPGIKDPVGMAGVRLEAEVHIVTGAVTSAQNICESIRRAGIEVEDVVLEPLASSYSVLSQDEKDLGVGLLDVGGGTTDIALFFDGSIRHTAVIAFGGNNVTRDMAIGLRTPSEQAERIKIEHGCALGSLVEGDAMIQVPGVGGRALREVTRKELCAIIEPRMEEIFTLVLREIKRTDYVELMSTGMVLTGGGAMMDGTAELAERIFDLPVRLGVPQGVTGLTDEVTSPIHATGVGLVLYGAMHRSRGGGMIAGAKGDRLFYKILSRMKRWFQEFV